jgi:hypothetical protein
MTDERATDSFGTSKHFPDEGQLGNSMPIVVNRRLHALCGPPKIWTLNRRVAIRLTQLYTSRLKVATWRGFQLFPITLSNISPRF